jgi:hypothetical protein
MELNWVRSALGLASQNQRAITITPYLTHSCNGLHLT